MRVSNTFQTLCLVVSLLLVAPTSAQVPVSPATEILTLNEPIFRFIIDAELTVTSVDTLADMWQGDTNLIDLALADDVLTVVSDSPADDNTPPGTGALRLVLRGNTSEEFPQFQSVEIDMNGTTPESTTEIFQGFSLAQARVILSDDFQRFDLPTGTITITQGGVTVGVIPPLALATRHGFRRIPFGPNGQVQTWDIVAGDLSISDLVGKPDSKANVTLWTFSPGDQAHTDAGTTIQSATSPIALLLLSTFDSGETFSLRLTPDELGVQFFGNLVANVTVKRIGPTVTVRTLQ